MEDKIGSVERNLNAKSKMCQLCIKMWEKCTLLKIVVFMKCNENMRNAYLGLFVLHRGHQASGFDILEKLNVRPLFTFYTFMQFSIEYLHNLAETAKLTQVQSFIYC